MIKSIFGIFDNKAEIFQQTFESINVPTAIRAFSQLVNDNRSSINQNPDDYVLFKLGSFDDQKGIYTNETAPLNICMASNCIVKPLTEVVKGFN